MLSHAPLTVALFVLAGTASLSVSHSAGISRSLLQTKFDGTFVITSCTDFWSGVSANAHKQIPWDAKWCAESDAEVGTAIDDILGRGLTKPLLYASTSTAGGHAHYARGMAAGITTFFIEAGLNPVNNSDYPSISADSVYGLTFRPDNPAGGLAIGKELCRLTGSLQQKVFILYGGPQPGLEQQDPYFDVRIRNTEIGFRENCPNSKFDIVNRNCPNPYTPSNGCNRGDWTRKGAKAFMKKAFIVDTTITTVLAANDEMAIGVIQAADEVFDSRKAKKMIITGFDHTEASLPFLKSNRLIATVDPLLGLGANGVWSVMPQVLQSTIEDGYANTQAVMNSYSIPDSTMTTPVMLFSSDPEGYVISTLEGLYQETVRASPLDPDVGVTEVKVSLTNFAVDEIDIGSGDFATSFWLIAEWRDQRLSWDDLLLNSTLQWSNDALWGPDLYFPTIVTAQESSLIFQGKATVTPGGEVRKATRVRGQFVCEMQIQPYPYDVHECAIEVSVTTSDTVIGLVPVELADQVEGPGAFNVFATGVSTSTIGETSPSGTNQQVVTFNFRFVRNPSFASMSYVLVTWALNLVSFGQHWITPGSGGLDRAGLAITTILAATALQLEGKVAQEQTWLDLFFSISIAYMFTCFFQTIIAVRVEPDPDPSLRVNWVDQLARLFLVPSFIIVCLVIPFLPRGGAMNISIHEESGINSPLFQANVGLAVIYLTYLIFFEMPYLFKKNTTPAESESPVSVAQKQHHYEIASGVTKSDEGMGVVENCSPGELVIVSGSQPPPPRRRPAPNTEV